MIPNFKDHSCAILLMEEPVPPDTCGTGVFEVYSKKSRLDKVFLGPSPCCPFQHILDCVRSGNGKCF